MKGNLIPHYLGIDLRSVAYDHEQMSKQNRYAELDNSGRMLLDTRLVLKTTLFQHSIVTGSKKLAIIESS